MKHRVSTLAVACAALVIQAAALSFDLACGGAPPPGHTVLNADQTVIIIWDPVTELQAVCDGDRMELIPIRSIKSMRGFLRGMDTTIER